MEVFWQLSLRRWEVSELINNKGVTVFFLEVNTLDLYLWFNNYIWVKSVIVQGVWQFGLLVLIHKLVCIVPVFVCMQQRKMYCCLILLGKLPHWKKLNYWQSLTKTLFLESPLLCHVMSLSVSLSMGSGGFAAGANPILPLLYKIW